LKTGIALNKSAVPITRKLNLTEIIINTCVGIYKRSHKVKDPTQKPDKRQKLERRRLWQEIADGISAAYLGPCPACQGNVCGAIDRAKCSDCSWSNFENYYERGAA
jgi:hypothetical protein